MTSARSPFWRVKYHAPAPTARARVTSPAIQYGRREARLPERPGTLRVVTNPFVPLLPIGGLRGGEPLGGPSVCGYGSWRVVGSVVLLITPHPAVVELHQLEVEIKLHPGGQVTHPERVQEVLGTQQVALGLEHLVGQGGRAAGVRSHPRDRGLSQHRLGVI